jgi:hypothetical protein
VAGEENLRQRKAEFRARRHRRAARQRASPVTLARVYQYHCMAKM